MALIGVGLLVLVCTTNSFVFSASKNNEKKTGAVFLTPDIEEGLISQAQKRAEATPLGKKIKNYAGYLTVDKMRGSNMFFWYFPPLPRTVPPDEAPVVLWLNGGPGASSLFGALKQTGPYILKKNGSVKFNKKSWASFAHMLYIDNPVGVGFSFTESEDGYSKNETHIGQNLYLTLVQFFKLFPDLQKNPLIIAGSSYAGKYLPALGITIHRNNPHALLKINLQGIVIGNGWVDPINMLDFGDILYFNGLLDTNGRHQFNKIRDQVKELIRQKEYAKAYDVYDPWILGDTTPYPTLYTNLTGLNTYFNHLRLGKKKKNPKDPKDHGKSDVFDFFNEKGNAWKLNVGNRKFDRPFIVAESLREDILTSVVDWLAVLMENYRVLIFNGNLDIKVGFALTENYLNKMKWKGAEAFKLATRKQWRVGRSLAGYVKTAGNFTQIVVRNAGHGVNRDQPEWAALMMYIFAYNQRFDNKKKSMKIQHKRHK